ncbi:transposase [Azospirillum canadense]|nr:transposase [Azospirillum canadense]MCW2239628.1 transposase [Azospirillum canadense]
MIIVDMRRPYWTVICELMPKARVVDRWHVRRDANMGWIAFGRR